MFAASLYIYIHNKTLTQAGSGGWQLQPTLERQRQKACSKFKDSMVYTECHLAWGHYQNKKKKKNQLKVKFYTCLLQYNFTN